ncbi:MAG: FAD:protein FMN transferase [Flavobacteriales bacterium]|nr:FAD:protein FMN transferase [Flavobacteriales bacterium]
MSSPFMIRFFYIPLLVLNACIQNKSEAPKTVKISGSAQGTTFAITYLDDEEREFVNEVDSLLRLIDQSMSLWVDSSLISRLNKGMDSVVTDLHFLKVFNTGQKISETTSGAFDMTVGALVRTWGFSPGTPISIDSTVIDSISRFTGYQNVSILPDGKYVRKHKETQIDFNAIAQGYTVDVLAEFLEEKNISNYLVEVGGELRTAGKNGAGEAWVIGIDFPMEDVVHVAQVIIHVSDKSVATSGNYRKFFEYDGVKYAHTIDPKTGYPARHTLLSATIVADYCMDADAYATALMVMGTDSAKVFLKDHPELEAFLIFGDDDGRFNTWMTDTFKARIIEEKKTEAPKES